MSDAAIDELLEEADFYMDYFVSTIMEKLLKEDVDAHDYDSLRHHLKSARDTAFQLEYQPQKREGL